MNKKILSVMALVSIALFLPYHASAVWVGNCLNDTALFIREYDHTINDTIECPYGCVEGYGQYGADCLDKKEDITFTMLAWLGAFTSAIFTLWGVVQQILVNREQKNGQFNPKNVYG